MFAVTVLVGQVHFTNAQGAEVTQDNLAFSGCFPNHQFEVCAEISGVRHQIVTQSGRAITGFKETSCFTITEFGAFVSQRCQTEMLTSISIDGFLKRSHDSGHMEFRDGVQTCSGRFRSEIKNGVLVLSESLIECV